MSGNIHFLLRAIFGALVYACFSCTVLEDRGDCPCILHLNMSDPANQVSDSLVVCLSASGYSMSLAVPRSSYADGMDVRIPHRGGVYINVYDCESGQYLENDSMSIPIGEQCPHTFMHSFFVDMSEEYNEAFVRLRKNYCGVTVSLVSEQPSDDTMCVDGNVCGYEMNGNPLKGHFSYDCEFQDANTCSFRVPRQIDGSLRMGVSAAGEQPRYFAIGNYILQSGYDWEKDDLDDIVISIDYMSSTVNLDVNDWHMAIDMDVLI